MKTFAKRAKHIRETLSSKERFADMLSLIGIDVDRTHKFTLRDERTPSIQIYNTGTAFDFGEGGGRLDIIDIISSHENLSEVKALERAENILGINNGGEASYQFKAPVYKNSNGTSDTEYDDTPMRESYIKYFRDMLHKNRVMAQKHLVKIMPTASNNEIDRMVAKFEIGYDPKNDKLTFPVRSVKDDHVMNLAKYTSEPKVGDNDKLEPKIKYIYGRRRTLFNLSVLKTAPKVVYIFEGEKDVINATLEGKSAITQGASTGWRDWMPKSIEAACKHYGVEMPIFVILQDHDRPGVLATLRIYKSLREIANSKMLFWKNDIANRLATCESAKEFASDIGVLNIKVDSCLISKGFDYTDYKVAIN